ncbi:hypothetical protein OESDEN_09909 [Oesophagostomum dentatum]|uniref:Sugar phosphate phosphatase n=1 Tax=Oesophagostomum dentatum TaxID=61180 RepID=A0A0B1SY87_OESDE|nr:hypothetical protein OESDEN_09909 [Oesophagostomum dentatum]
MLLTGCFIAALFQHGEEEVTWFKMDWLFTECLMYRIVVGAVAKTKFLNNFDIFREQKIEGFNSHLDHIRDNINYMLSVAGKLDEKQEKETLEVLLKMCLWGNKCDLSLSCGESSVLKQSPTEATRTLDSFILCNDIKTAIESFLLKLKPNKKGLRELHIVLDNAGPELVGDLVLAEYLMESKLVDKTVLHGKEYPYFVSDVTGGDFEWTMAELNKLGGVCQQLYQRLSERVKKEALHGFLPAPLLALRALKAETVAGLPADVAEQMRQKPDLQWMALHGFLPAPLLALRALKAETVAGLSAEVAERMRQKPDLQWMVTGEYGVAQLTF